MKRATWFLAILACLLAPLAAQTVTVTSPNGGEIWAAGSAHAITWNFTNPGSAVVNIILRNGGGKVGPIKTGVALSKGTYTWANVSVLENGAPVPNGSDYVVRISIVGMQTSDVSNAAFSIGGGAPPPPPGGGSTLTLTSPNGGETWKCGETQNITWIADWSGTVQLNLYQDGYGFRGIIASGVPSMPGSFPWKVGSTTDKGTFFGAGCTVKIVKVYPGHLLPVHPLADDSNGGFFIKPCIQMNREHAYAAVAKPNLVVCKWGPGQLTQETLCEPTLACFNLTLKVFNTGNLESQECWLKVTFAGGGGSSRKIPALKAGESTVQTFLINTNLDAQLSAKYTILVDEKNDVDESYEGDNVLEGALSVNALEYGKCSDGKQH